MNVTAPYTHTAKSRQLLKDYDNAELLGQRFKCFFTGVETEISDYKVFSLKVEGEWKYFRIYVKGHYSILSGSKLREAVENRLKEIRVSELRDLAKKLTYSTSEINLNFRIKVSGTRDGKKYNKLVGVTGLIDIIGLELAEKLINRAFDSQFDNIYCKLRTGLKITFYSK